MVKGHLTGYGLHGYFHFFFLIGESNIDAIYLYSPNFFLFQVAIACVYPSSEFSGEGLYQVYQVQLRASGTQGD